MESEKPHILSATSSPRGELLPRQALERVPVQRRPMVDGHLPGTWLCRATLARDVTPSGGLRVEAPLNAMYPTNPAAGVGAR